jgi:PAS domain S-box-containing protein
MSLTPSIMIVENDSESLAWLVEILHAAGFHVRSIDEGIKALASIYIKQPDLLFLGSKLLGPSGLEICRCLKANPETADFPVVLITGRTDVQDMAEGLRLGVADYLTVPAQKEELLARIPTYLALGQMRLQITDKNAELEMALKNLKHTKDLFDTLSQIHQIIVRAENKDELFQEIVRICIECGLLDLAWIGVPDETRKELRVVAVHGPSKGFVDGIEIGMAADQASVLGPSGISFQEAKPVIVQDWSTEPALALLHSRVATFHIRSSAAFPMFQGDRAVGVLALYSKEAGFFNADLIRWLGEMVEDIGYALNAMAMAFRQRYAEEELRVKKEHSSLSFAQAGIGKAHTSPNGRFLRVNDALSLMLGYSRSELEAGSFAEFTHPEDITAGWESVRNLLAGEHATGRFEKRYIHKDGHTVWAYVSTMLLHDADGPLYFVTDIVDITEGKRAEKERAAAQAQLQHTQNLDSLGSLASGVAHNINNVLAIIMGTASVQEENTINLSDREAYQRIDKACRRGREVVKSLIHFAQPVLASKAPFELHSLIQEVCILLGNTTRNRIKIIENYAEEPLWTIGDLGSINHVLLNLCINAIDAMPDGGTLTFQTAILEGNWVEVVIEDTGEGMTPEVLSHIMEPFYTTKAVGKGTGLGLSMTYGVVKAHGGTIDIASHPGQGTSVKLLFPRIPAPVQNKTVASLLPSLGEMSIYLVDDDEDVRFLMARMLKQAGVLQVKTFSAGEEVLEHLRTGDLPDLIILDQNMPGMDGTQTMEVIRSLHPEMPILISSGQPAIETWGSLKRPKVAVISKPFTFEEIQVKLVQFAAEPKGLWYKGD